MFGRPDTVTVGTVCYAWVFVRLCVAVFLEVARLRKKAVVRTIFVMLGTQIQTVRKLDTDDGFSSLNVQNFSLWFPCDFQWENTIRIELPGTKKIRERLKFQIPFPTRQ